MLDLLSKPAGQITVDEINILVDSQVQEGNQIEFKESLPGNGEDPDPWMEGKDKISDRARNTVLEETVAFANAYGGALLIGIRESNSKPPVATEITSLPRCAELAERLRMMFRDCVEPQLPRLEVFCVKIKADKGVVVIRVGRSRLAPHRVIPTLACPIRRADRCEKMTMREIQDMTLNVSRGMERLERRLATRSERFQKEFDRLNTPADSHGLRFTALPVGEEVQFDRVFSQGKIVPELCTPWRRVNLKNGNSSQELDSLPEFPPSIWRPILRGARADTYSRVDAPS